MGNETLLASTLLWLNDVPPEMMAEPAAMAYLSDIADFALLQLPKLEFIVEWMK